MQRGGLYSLAVVTPYLLTCLGLWIGLAAFSALSICPGLYFRGHYFVLLLPAAALLSAVGIRAMATAVVGGARPDRVTAMFLVASVLGCGQVLWSSRQYLFELTPTEVSRATYGLNPFPESLIVADFIRNNTEATDSIAVIGSQPQIYFYSKRPPASSYMYTYPLVEAQPFNRRMQDEFIREIEDKQPEALVFVQYQSSWMASADAPKKVFRWLSGYLRAFELALVVESGDSGARVHEGEVLARFRDQIDEGLYVYLRK